jgi:hypothetical protein
VVWRKFEFRSEFRSVPVAKVNDSSLKPVPLLWETVDGGALATMGEKKELGWSCWALSKRFNRLFTS